MAASNQPPDADLDALVQRAERNLNALEGFARCYHLANESFDTSWSLAEVVRESLDTMLAALRAALDAKAQAERCAEAFRAHLGAVASDNVVLRHQLQIAEQRAEALAAKIAAAEQPKVCAGCKWVRHLNDPIEGPAVCAHESEAHPLHWSNEIRANPERFGCTMWEPRAMEDR